MMGRSFVYGALARGFSWPDEKLLSVFDPAEFESGGPLGEIIGRMAEAAGAAGANRLRSEYMRVFDPRRPPPPMEAECLGLQGTQRSMLLADVMGFYNAFGVTPSNERPDHIACELDFMNLLGVKEAAAIESGHEERTLICAEAREKFLDSHLLKWREPLGGLIRERVISGDSGFYERLADALDAVLLDEGESVE